MKTKVKSPLQKKIEKLIANRLAIMGFVLVLIILLACIAAPIITDFDPREIDYGAILQAPTKSTL